MFINRITYIYHFIHYKQHFEMLFYEKSLWVLCFRIICNTFIQWIKNWLLLCLRMIIEYSAPCMYVLSSLNNLLSSFSKLNKHILIKFCILFKILFKKVFIHLFSLSFHRKNLYTFKFSLFISNFTSNQHNSSNANIDNMLWLLQLQIVCVLSLCINGK